MDISKLLLLGGAGYLGYKFFIEPASAPAAVAPVGAGIVPVNTPAPTTNPNTTRNMVLAAAGDFKVGNVWEWDFFYKKARGVDADLAAKIPEADRMKNLTFDEWWAVAQANGLSGVIPTSRVMMPQRRGVGYIPASRLMVMDME